jgi:hypothetical protein
MTKRSQSAPLAPSKVLHATAAPRSVNTPRCLPVTLSQPEHEVVCKGASLRAVHSSAPGPMNACMLLLAVRCWICADASMEH